ncbi:MATE family efflux transporter [Reyranella soli]|uniref:Cation efflux system protein n=1 Tax=Reyranella soli TaxID=1230389 RepID=A0A512NGR1_9HYPH|nr:MATE family efflux transporter [Reyranella soli]GEP58143.1 cation efflux system protein [Reyranella soli]
MSPEQRRQSMLVGPLLPTILTLAAPNVVNVSVQSLVLIADGWFVGRLGTAELAALALVFPAQTTLQMMSAGAMGGGVSSSVARALGSGDRDRADATAAHALVIAAVMTLLFAVVFVGFGRPLFGALGGSGVALEGAIAFSTVMFLGCGAHWLANTLASILRGSGDMKTPGYALITLAILQIPLSGALTLGWLGMPRLGVASPALAAVISYAVAAVWILLPILQGRAAVRLRWPARGFRWPIFVDILKIGATSCVVVILINAAVLVVIGLIGRAGDAAIAGYGVGSRLEYLLSPLTFGIGAALTAMVGTNKGARQFARARQAAWTGALIAGAVTMAIGLTVALFPDLWLRLFTDDPAALEAGRLYFRIVGPTYGLFGLAMALNFAAMGAGDMIWPTLATATRIVVVIGGGLLALDVLGWAAPGLYACVAAGVVAYALLLAVSTTRRAWHV